MADDYTPRRDSSDAPRRRDNEFEGAGGGGDFRLPDRGSGGGDGGGGGDNQIMGWLLFILIFGVGNAILYSTTGIFIIPIRR